MNWDEYNILFHKHNLNLVAFKRLMECDHEVLKLVNAALDEVSAERDALLAACKVIVCAFDGLKPDNPARYEPLHINAARAAIAKVEGEKK